MGLLRNQVQELAQHPKNKTCIEKAKRHEARLRFHTETLVEPSTMMWECNEFLEWVRNILPKEKFMIFLSLFRFPIFTNENVEQVYNALEKVFEAKDPYYDYKFKSDSAKEDWEQYLDNELGGQEEWRQKAFTAMKTAINSIMIVDLDTLSIDEEGNLSSDSFLPEPYWYLKPIQHVHDFGTDKYGDIEYLMFIKEKEDNQRDLYVFDDVSYRVFEMEGNDIAITPKIESSHSLGYCPAKFFWTDSLQEKEKSIKKSPISNQLSNLDKLLFRTIGKDHLDLYASYPIYYGYEVDCDYKHPSSGEYCDGGFIKDDGNQYMIGKSGEVLKCPVCSSKRFAGAGNYVEMPYPDKEQGIENVGAPIGLVTVDKGSLDYNRDEIERMSINFYASVVGYSSDIPDQAVNKLQVAANFEDRKTVIENLKGNFEEARKWRDDTICLLRYGSEVYEGSSINMGTEWYLSSIEELIEKYDSAKKAGAHDSELDILQDQIMEMAHKNNPKKLHRAKILSQLEPFRHMTRTEVMKDISGNTSLFDPVQIQIKINFSNFIQRFEREYIDVVTFGESLSFDKKISKIQETLESYVYKNESEGSGEIQDPEPNPIEEPNED